MTQYNQAMKHWRNHKKDRFFQQCAAPVASLQYPHLSEEEKRKRSNESLEALLDQAVDFPFLSIKISGLEHGKWFRRIICLVSRSLPGMNSLHL